VSVIKGRRVARVMGCPAPPGTPIEARTYPEARHGFDAQVLPPFARFGSETVGYNAAAAEAASRDIDEFMNNTRDLRNHSIVRDRVTYGEEMDVTPFCVVPVNHAPGRLGYRDRSSRGARVVLRQAGDRGERHMAELSAASGSDCDFGGLVGLPRRRGDGVGDPVPDLIQLIHHVPHRYRRLLQ
jgi:hypothetical protein